MGNQSPPPLWPLSNSHSCLADRTTSRQTIFQLKFSDVIRFANCRRNPSADWNKRIFYSKFFLCYFKGGVAKLFDGGGAEAEPNRARIRTISLFPVLYCFTFSLRTAPRPFLPNPPSPRCSFYCLFTADFPTVPRRGRTARGNNASFRRWFEYLNITLHKQSCYVIRTPRGYWNTYSSLALLTFSISPSLSGATAVTKFQLTHVAILRRVWYRSMRIAIAVIRLQTWNRKGKKEMENKKKPKNA